MAIANRSKISNTHKRQHTLCQNEVTALLNERHCENVLEIAFSGWKYFWLTFTESSGLSPLKP
eukprot:3585129-Amphidinium_carterae.1